MPSSRLSVVAVITVVAVIIRACPYRAVRCYKHKGRWTYVERER
jgi:hypothetical protein